MFNPKLGYMFIKDISTKTSQIFIGSRWNTLFRNFFQTIWNLYQHVLCLHENLDSTSCSLLITI